MIRCVLLLLLAAAAGCSTTPRPGGGPSQSGANPHYKVGQPYQIGGRWFHPKVDENYDAVGVASWYGDQFHGRKTANGEIFDKRRLSAAHTTLPMPTIVEVENLENGRRVTVRVNDRGPFVGDRIIDLSEAAARALGFEHQGLARVRVRYLGHAELADLAPMPGERLRFASRERAPARVAAAPQPAAPQQSRPAVVASAEPLRMAPVASPGDALAMAPVVSAGDGSAERDFMGSFIDNALNAPVESWTPAEIWIAVDDYADLNALEAARLSLAEQGSLRIVSGGTAGYALQVGPFASADDAEARLAALREAGYSRAVIDSQACAPVAYVC